jgi:hypothetical protein
MRTISCCAFRATLVLVLLGWPPFALAQRSYFVGALGGLSTLSGDGRSEVGSDSSAVSLYKPENGPALNVFGGVHLTDYLSVQGNYIWNRNSLRLNSTLSSAASAVFYEQSRASSQHSVSADLLLYFRNRRSWVRPYLSAGAGGVRFCSRAETLLASSGSPALPPGEFTSTDPTLRVAVGIDLAIRHGWAFRYSFAETMSSNPISAQLSPPAPRGLKNFQNLFGFVKIFGGR